MLQIERDVQLLPLTTFKIGGRAKHFVSVETENELQEAVRWAGEGKLKFTILAGGSNVLIPDNGLDGLVIHIVGENLTWNHNVLHIWAGSNLLKTIHEAAARNLGGWEKLSGIPGTIGGAVRGNAGAFGTEIKDFVINVKAFNSKTGETKEFDNNSCSFSYRYSFFKNNSEWIITYITIRLDDIESPESLKIIEETIQEREKRHLQNVQAAGSFFMNPVAPADIVEIFEKEKNVKSRENRVPAGWLIEKAGMKGFRIGNAIASEQHPNYLVNTGSATAKDVLELAEKIKEEVKNRFNILLAEEAAIL